MDTDELNKLLDRFYATGMHLADCLRLLGKHEDSKQIEMWVLNLCREYQK